MLDPALPAPPPLTGSESPALLVERGLLGLLLVDPSCLPDATQLDPDDFLDPRHGRLFAILRELAAAGHPDRGPAALVLELQRRGELEAVGGVNYVAGLVADERALPRLLPHLIEKVRDEALRRRADRALAQAMSQVADRQWPLDELYAGLQSELAAVTRRQIGAGDGLIGLDPLMTRLRALADAPDLDRRLPTGFGPLDERLQGGLRPGQLLVIAGLTGSGKSALGTQLALGAAWHVAHNPARYTDAGRVLYLSFEMAADELGLRMVRQVADIADGWEPLRGGWSASDRSRAEAAMTQLATLPLEVTEASLGATIRPTTEAVAAAVERHVARHGTPPLVVVDHLHLLRAGEVGNRTAEVERVVTDLAELARRFGIPVMLLAQMNRGSQRRDDPRPKLSDLKDTSAIEQIAHTVVFVHRPERAIREAETVPSEAPERAELIVAKQRGGQAGTIEALWLGWRFLFLPNPGWTPRLPLAAVDDASLFEPPVLPAVALPPARPAPRSDPELVCDMVRAVQATGRWATRDDLRAGAKELRRDAASSWSNWWVGRTVDALLRAGRLRGEQATSGNRAWTYWLPEPLGPAPTSTVPGRGDPQSPRIDEEDELGDDIPF